MFPVLAGPEGWAAPSILALALLGDAAPHAPIVVVHSERIGFIQISPTAWTDGVTIFVSDQSEPYRKASKKDARPLAAALAHEGYHLAHGPDEAPAYAEQLRVMRGLAARPADIDVVERAAARFR